MFRKNSFILKHKEYKSLVSHKQLKYNVNITLFDKCHFIATYNNKEYKININNFAKTSYINKGPCKVKNSLLRSLIHL